MPWKIDSNDVSSATDAAISITASKEADVQVTNNKITDCTNGIVMRELVPTIKSLGLPSTTNPEELRDLLSLLLNTEDKGNQREKAVRSSKLWSRVQNLANASSIMDSLVSMGAPMITAVIAAIANSAR